MKVSENNNERSILKNSSVIIKLANNGRIIAFHYHYLPRISYKSVERIETSQTEILNFYQNKVKNLQKTQPIFLKFLLELNDKVDKLMELPDEKLSQEKKEEFDHLMVHAFDKGDGYGMTYRVPHFKHRQKFLKGLDKETSDLYMEDSDKVNQKIVFLTDKVTNSILPYYKMIDIETREETLVAATKFELSEENKSDDWAWFLEDNYNNFLPANMAFFTFLKRLVFNQNDSFLPPDISYLSFISNPIEHTSFLIDVQLHWWLSQMSGAIWENDGLANVINKLMNGLSPTWRNGYEKLNKISIYEREDIQKDDPHKMSAILLYDFATGTGPDEIHFKETDAFAKSLNKDNFILKDVIRKFYKTMKIKGFNKSRLFLDNYEDKIFRTSFNFSPDHTGSLKESWEKHIFAWNNNPIAFIIGGIEAEIFYNYVEEMFNISLTNKMGKRSLLLHMAKNKDDYYGPLRSKKQNFLYKLSCQEFQKLQ